MVRSQTKTKDRINEATMRSATAIRRKAFSIIELLVVIGIISLLMAMLFPALAGARQRATSLQCQSNLSQIGMMLQIYANNNNGWPSPVVLSPAGKPVGRGMLLPPDQRWPMYVFDVPTPPEPTDGATEDPWPYTPPILRCPTEQDPLEAHSYVLNWDPIADHAKQGNGHMAFERSVELIIMAEKYGTKTDYYLEPFKDLSSIVDFYHHNQMLFSNYLYGDGHVQSATPSQAIRDIRHVPSDEVE
jgi:prepilin-type N-terminal cleavage/methylation domain-containing protein/prepilin-type processing-associated H-X9-DG protein